MKKAEMMRVAIGAARSELRRNGLDPASISSDSALMVLDDICRVDPELIASLWYNDASDNQIRLFKKKWRKK